MSGQDIANQVHLGLLQAARATGNGVYSSVLRKKDGVGFTYQTLSCVSVNKKSFDTMAMVQRTNRLLLVSPTGPVPVKGDHVGVGFTAAQEASVTHWARVEHADEVNPAGTVLLYRLKLSE